MMPRIRTAKPYLTKPYLIMVIVCLGFGITKGAFGMGLRTFVALPIEKGGSVVRFSVEKNQSANSDTFISNYAYGISADKTLLLGFPYRLSPTGDGRQGDLSLLYRQTIWQKDQSTGTDRLSLLAGTVLPTDSTREAAAQAGFVFTHFKNRHEIDADVLYQAGLKDRKDRGRYDLSWQYRLSPRERPEWGFGTEWNSVLELNGRWNEGSKTSQQITAGLQRITQNWVIEAGVSQDLNTDKATRYLLSTRFHF